MSKPEAIEIFSPIRRRGECKLSAIPGKRLNRMPTPSGIGMGIRPLGSEAMALPGDRGVARLPRRGSSGCKSGLAKKADSLVTPEIGYFEKLIIQAREFSRHRVTVVRCWKEQNAAMKIVDDRETEWLKTSRLENVK